MNMVLRGVVHGKTIVVSEDLGLSDGQAVELIVMPTMLSETPPVESWSQVAPKKLPGPPPGWKPGGIATAAGMMAEEWTEEDDRILDQIHADRKAATWRELPQ